MRDENNKEKSDDHYIKTIRIFDNEFKQINSILVEQVKVPCKFENEGKEGIDGIFPCNEDTSTFQN